MVLVLLSTISFPAFAADPVPSATNSKIPRSGYAEIDMPKARIGGSYHERVTVGSGTWSYGVGGVGSTGNFDQCYSKITATGYSQHKTTVQPGAYASQSSSGWKGKYGASIQKKQGSSGNKAWYDVK